MTIEVGKWYMTRSGHKAFVAAKTSGAYSFYGHVETGADFQLDIWTEAGRAGFDGSDEPMDLVSPWSNKPILDWSKEREWVKAVAMDRTGAWWRYSSLPVACNVSWVANDFCQQLHPTERPTSLDGSPWAGDWKESLIVRPEGGGK